MTDTFSFQRRIADAVEQRRIALERRALYYPGSMEWGRENDHAEEWGRVIDQLREEEARA